MASACLWGGPIFIRDANGVAVDGALITINITGTDTPAEVWHDAGRTVPWDQPLTCDANGSPGALVFVSPTPTLDIFVTDANGVDVPGYQALAWTPYDLAS